MQKLLAIKKESAEERNPMRRQSTHTMKVRKTQDELDEKEEKVCALHGTAKVPAALLCFGFFFFFWLRSLDACLSLFICFASHLLHSGLSSLAPLEAFSVSCFPFFLSFLSANVRWAGSAGPWKRASLERLWTGKC